MKIFKTHETVSLNADQRNFANNHQQWNWCFMKEYIKSRGNKWRRNVFYRNLLWHIKWNFKFLRALIVSAKLVNSKTNMMMTTKSFNVIYFIQSLSTKNFYDIECQYKFFSCYLKWINFSTDYILRVLWILVFSAKYNPHKVSLKLSFTKFHPWKSRKHIWKVKKSKFLAVQTWG